MMPVRDKLISSMLQPAASKGPLIQAIGGEEGEVESPSPGVVEKPREEGPSILEQMMALQAEARKEKEKEKEVLVKASSMSFGNGFKKGFFGGSGGKSAPSSSSSSPSMSTKPSTAESIPTIRPAQTVVKGGSCGKSSLVLDEVQTAMKTDNPVLAQLQQGDWVTPDLTKIMMGNEILSRGLRNPKCTAAIELMQSNPKEAQRRFQGDPEVDIFMREFGRVMGAHFEALGNSNQKQQQAGAGLAGRSSSSGSDGQVPVGPVGPLHAEVLKKAEGQRKIIETSQAEEEQVKRIIGDPELTAMLMDPELQRILQECGDPVKFQRHMRDPVIACKILRLREAGLVGMAE